jgi:hypothetical protein
MNFLLFDFGASRIKSIFFDTKNDELSELYSTPGASLDNINQVPIEFFLESFQQHLSYRKSKNKKIDAINICCEMHGFALVKDLMDIKKDHYISWRANNCKDLKSELEFYFPNNNFKNLTGMNARKGLPIFNIRRHKNYDQESIFLTLPECIISKFGEWNGTMSKSLAAGTGLYDIKNNQWLGLTNKISNIKFPEVKSHIDHTYGHIVINGKKVPVYGSIGDLQACILSLDLKENEINVNLGTGSQVSKKFQKGDDSFELRPTFNKEFFSTITHIPCGRALNIFSKIIEKKFKNNFFWNKFFMKSDIDNINKIAIDLNVFEGSYKYKGGIDLKNIEERNYDENNLIDNIKFSFVKQYADIINSYNKKNKNSVSKIILTGALANKIIDFKSILNFQTKVDVEILHNKIDSSLIGLSKISKNILEKKN